MLIAALAAILVTCALVLTQPRVRGHRLGPATAAFAGVLVLGAAGALRIDDPWRAVVALGPAVVGIAAVMAMSAACARLGALDLLADTIEARAGSSTLGLFVIVFAGSWVTAGVLNNDAAVVINTTLVASLLRRRFATRPGVAEPFLLAVFLGAGVAPLVVSNPMNLTVAHLAGLDFLAYARAMIPVSFVGAVVTLGVLVAFYARRLRGAAAVRASVEARATSRSAKAGLVLVAVVLVAYVPAAIFSVPSWIVSLAGAATALVRRSHGSARDAVTSGVSFEVLAVLPMVFMLAAGLERAGFIDALAPAMIHRGALQVGLVSALGSALLNNHTMAIISVHVLVDGGAGTKEILAALVGGDLGPRLLPFGSLAGLLWLDALRRQGLEVSLRRFMLLGVITGVPALFACLFVLRLL